MYKILPITTETDYICIYSQIYYKINVSQLSKIKDSDFKQKVYKFARKLNIIQNAPYHENEMIPLEILILLFRLVKMDHVYLNE